MGKKTIALYITSMHRGGAERVMSILANFFADKGHRVVLATDILVGGKEDYTLSKKIECVHIKPTSNNFFLKNLQRIKQLRKVIKDSKADVALSFLGKQNYRMLIATIGLKCRKCVSVRNDPNREYGKSKIRKWLANRMFNLADACVFQTEDAKKYFSKRIQKKSVVIPNPVDVKFFNVKRANNPKNVITVGRLEPQKNQKLLIDAFAAIADRISDEKLLIYGVGSLEKELKSYIKKIGMSDRIIMMGEVDDIEKELAKAKLFVLSSDYEGMPNALMEAMVVGVPCISTDCPCGGPRELLKDAISNTIVSCNNLSKLSDAIILALNNGSTSFNRQMDKYTIQAVMVKWGIVLNIPTTFNKNKVVGK